MSRKFLLIVMSAAITAIIVIATTYIATFGVSRSLDQAVWGTFGDYFGGILNPTFALFAFFGVLWSLNLQMKQVAQLGVDKKAAEILQVIKDIDNRLAELLNTLVATASERDVLIIHMIAEARRIVEQDNIDNKFLAANDIYIEFLKDSKSSDSLTGMAVREMADQVSTMSEFLNRYPQPQGGVYAPIIEYYIAKTSRLIPMLRDAGSLSASTRALFDTTTSSR